MNSGFISPSSTDTSRAHLPANVKLRLNWKSRGLRVAYLSTYPPRECGIATFCQDLLIATSACSGAGEPMVIAMENDACRASYGRPVVRTVDDRTPPHYEQAAHFVNDSPADVVCLQHEFGIYGGTQEPSLYYFLRKLKKPLVSILHTVTPAPDKTRLELTRELARRSDRLVVMNDFARAILADDYLIDISKIAVIHHGAPFFPKNGRETVKKRLGLEGRQIISTFGLVSRGKGIEYMLEALPGIVTRHPKVLFLLIGKTHPGVQAHEKETYREALCRRVQELHLEAHVEFVNHYLGKPEIIDYLVATDIYVSPYLNPDQITSGTLAYAMAAGKALVSTPYLYARFLLDEGRGLLVNYRDADGLEKAMNRLLDDTGLRTEMEARNYAYGRDLLWPSVGRQYINLFHEVMAEEKVLAPALIAMPPVGVQTACALPQNRKIASG
jgi:polysaccharide biosynthesis protein PslF